MNPELDCIPCLLKQALKISDVLQLEEKFKQQIINQSMKLLSDTPLNMSTPYYSREIWKIIQQYTDERDPFKNIKKYYNQKMLKQQEHLEITLKEAVNPFLTGLKIAITGNIIDFGAKHDLDESTVIKEIDPKNFKPLYIDHSYTMLKEIRKAKKLVYLGDNCGEIVFDKHFIREIGKINPDLDIAFAARGAPIINDITATDAKQVKMDEVARIIDNDYDAPGTELEYSSEVFRKEFYEADLIISKGQGNFESLSHINRQNIFFLFMVKCNAVARQTNAKVGSLICFQKTD